ncbi:MAG TPA: hypothetical protein VLJ57_12460 [Burkholderiaceae bacterium]|nr:hypothetical protein [Burkholderiaceae bacterium]
MHAPGRRRTEFLNATWARLCRARLVSTPSKSVSALEPDGSSIDPPNQSIANSCWCFLRLVDLIHLNTQKESNYGKTRRVPIRRFRYQYRDEAQWQQFLERLEEAKLYRARTGQSRMLHRYDIVNLPEHYRAGLPKNFVFEFPAETAISMLTYHPEDVVAHIAPRPLLVIHSRGDDVVPVSESEHMAQAAGDNCELFIPESSNHFGSGESELIRVTLDWLGRHLPAVGK